MDGPRCSGPGGGVTKEWMRSRESESEESEESAMFLIWWRKDFYLDFV